jgi:uncharacterized protein
MTAGASAGAPAAAMRPRRYAVVTGGSGGIGYALARELAADGHDLLLVSRDEARLREAAARLAAAHGASVAILAVDLSQSEAADRVVAAWRAAGRPLDVLVNNAGFGCFGSYTDTPWPTLLEMMHLNMDALARLTHAALADMRPRHAGRILNVASTAAFQPGPWVATYYATKAFVLHLSEALAEELAGTGITVTALCPGPTATGFERRAGLEDSRLFRLLRPMSAEAVARAGYRGLRTGRRVVVPGARSRALTLVPRFFPRLWVTKMVRVLQGRRAIAR